MLTRRAFLATTAAAMSVRPSFGQTSPERLRLAAETGLLERTAGCDIVAQIDRAADLGFRAFGDASWFHRTPTEQGRIADAIENRGLTLAPVPDPLLTDGDDTRVTMFHPIVTGIRLAVGPAELDRLAESQLTDRWTELADAAATRGQTLFVEPWDDGRLGAALFTRCAGLVQRINHSALRLSLDACQLWRAGLRVRDLCHWYRDQIGHVELPAMSTSQHNDAVRGLRILWRTGLWRTGFRGVVGLRQGLSGPVDGAERQLVTLRQRLESDITGEHHFTMDEL